MRLVFGVICRPTNDLKTDRFGEYLWSLIFVSHIYMGYYKQAPYKTLCRSFPLDSIEIGLVIREVVLLDRQPDNRTTGLSRDLRYLFIMCRSYCKDRIVKHVLGQGSGQKSMWLCGSYTRRLSRG
jgi:hypothetical protein